MRQDNEDLTRAKQSKTRGEETNARSNDGRTQPQTATYEQLEQLQAELSEWQDKYTRLYAELENSKKRLARHYAHQAEQEKEALLRDILPLADNLERALDTSGPASEGGVRQGVALTLKAILDTLARHGLKQIEAEGQPFDPSLHQADGVIAHATAPAGTVVRVEQKGYTYHDKLLRPARVLVSSS